ncbi:MULTISPECIES: hypothetical protein [Nitratidesulfovibrio]|jgi:hypothetical protein|uniref:Uncharacterized protein n=2 Tax=Nitratidesulfovibrio TaxID=2802295 RepID=Q72AF6_NITV2|nr:MULTISPECIES: hypothetical protein [Nitratidesulfovibrio]GEB80401.1 hypothetical protein DDE01_18160 [Desulfovibrio desulfuricans]AAS96514.1 hypothetical protein DVU_2039 [Nitratidesulfovibrio vulgaris str. Hildenborough]ADP87046.1 hypothetical protein Deval_1895 [Nitratidesulfovibrio vulgaris RCH1]NHZ45095.1 hypothetical protein [Nitratidesulfovibrio liaohensis]WCB47051.1 hypothetical protein PH214_02935 [Nitratidesulfovibrio vulgaris]
MTPQTFPFSHSIELVRPTPRGNDYLYWRAEACKDALRICTWCADASGVPVEGRVIQTIACAQCRSEDPVLEMWFRASHKIDRMAFHITQGC